MNRRPRPALRGTGSVPSDSFKPSVPDLPSVKVALAGAAPLVGLLQRLDASKQCLEAVKPVLPGPLASGVRAGPLDDEGWTLLAPNAAVSAKLRQLQPRLMDALLQKGIKVNAIRVRVQTPHDR